MAGGCPHPDMAYAAILANALRPKAKYAAVIGSFGWGGKAAEHLLAMMPAFNPEVLGTVMAKGMPRHADYAEIEKLADRIAEKHKAL